MNQDSKQQTEQQRTGFHFQSAVELFINRPWLYFKLIIIVLLKGLT